MKRPRFDDYFKKDMDFCSAIEQGKYLQYSEDMKTYREWKKSEEEKANLTKKMTNDNNTRNIGTNSARQ